MHCRSVRGGATSHKFCSAGRTAGRPVQRARGHATAAQGRSDRQPAATHSRRTGRQQRGKLGQVANINTTKPNKPVPHRRSSIWCRPTWCRRRRRRRALRPTLLAIDAETDQASEGKHRRRAIFFWIEPYYAPWCVSGQIKNQNSTKNQRINPTLQFATVLSHLSHPTPKIINNIKKESKSQDNPGKYRTLCPLECRQPFCPFWFAAVARGALFGLLLWRGGLLESVL